MMWTSLLMIPPRDYNIEHNAGHNAEHNTRCYGVTNSYCVTVTCLLLCAVVVLSIYIDDVDLGNISTLFRLWCIMRICFALSTFFESCVTNRMLRARNITFICLIIFGIGLSCAIISRKVYTQVYPTLSITVAVFNTIDVISLVYLFMKAKLMLTTDPEQLPLLIEAVNGEYTYHLGTKITNTMVFEAGRCVICLMDFNEGDKITVISKCMHYYHKNCIANWFIYIRTCPICRAGVEIA